MCNTIGWTTFSYYDVHCSQVINVDFQFQVAIYNSTLLISSILGSAMFSAKFYT